ncbi:hypothetical protein K435DRAFT_965161 [Dendrothele bispora CBS 962.96]|uniref:Uncharacterized protein n=1 Tax=Dendrothele bispora (strain CBS 962.96) TaxID=1314807 RepID=A0A4S8M7F1_DENBC|nr:hypothetical protein K435DRAFT_965161 [Dendrothele bispora CBS 962.96]
MSSDGTGGNQFFNNASNNVFDNLSLNNVGRDQHHHKQEGNIQNTTRNYNASISKYTENDNSNVYGRKTENYGTYNETNNGGQEEDLPEPTRAAFFEHFEPVLIEFTGCADAWKDPNSKELQDLWIKSMPKDMQGQYSQFGKGIRKLAAERLTEWRNSIGDAAIVVLDSILEDKTQEEQARFIQEQTKGNYWDRVYYFSSVFNGKPTGSFQSQIVAQTLSTHFKAIRDIPEQNRSKNPPKAALVLSILAIERAFKHYAIQTHGNPPTDTFSSDERAQQSASRIDRLFGKKPDGKDRVSAETWDKIIAAAKSHLEPPTAVDVVEPDSKDELPQDFSYDD